MKAKQILNGHDRGCLGGHLGDCAVSGLIDFFQCPQCDRISHHPKDIEEGYCGACRDWTRPAPWAGEPCGYCGEPIPDGISVMIRMEGVFHVPCAFKDRAARGEL